MNNQIIAEQLNKLRTEKGLSQRQVALLAGMSRTHYTNLENGKFSPRLATLQKLNQVFDGQLLIFK